MIISKLKMFAIVGVILLFATMAGKIFNEGKILGNMRGELQILTYKFDLLKKENAQLEEEIRLARRTIKECENLKKRIENRENKETKEIEKKQTKGVTKK